MSINYLKNSCLDKLNLPDLVRVALKLKAKTENKNPNSISALEISEALKKYEVAIGKKQFDNECCNASKC